MTIIEFKPTAWQSDNPQKTNSNNSSFTSFSQDNSDTFQYWDYELEDEKRSSFFDKVRSFFSEVTAPNIHYNCKETHTDLYLKALNEYEKAMTSKQEADKIIFKSADFDFTKPVVSNGRKIKFYQDNSPLMYIMVEEDFNGNTLKQTKFISKTGKIREIEQYNPATKKYDNYKFYGENDSQVYIYKSCDYKLDLKNTGYKKNEDGFSFEMNAFFAKEFYRFKDGEPIELKKDYKKTNSKTSFKTAYIF